MVTEKRLRIGLVIDGTDHFIRPIEAALRKRHRIARFAPRFVRFPIVGKRLNDWLLVHQLGSFLRTNDVVFFEWAGPLAALSSSLSGQARRIVRAHRTELFSDLGMFRWTGIDRVVFVSNAMRSRFVEMFPDWKEKAVVVPNGVDLQRFSFDVKPFTGRICILGNLIPRKRAYDLICALADLPDHLQWQLIVGGAPVSSDLDYWEALKGLVKRARLGDKIVFAGQVGDVAAWLGQMDVFISASYSEGQQVALLEAMASGCYCLGHCWDGIEEILPPDNIYVTDSELRAKLIRYAALSDEARHALQAQMRTITEEKFDERRMVSQIVDLIEQVARESL